MELTFLEKTKAARGADTAVGEKEEKQTWNMISLRYLLNGDVK